MDEIRARLAEIKHQRSLMTPWDRAVLKRDELAAQRESWIRAMAPCEHGVADFEDCSQCRTPTTEARVSLEEVAVVLLDAEALLCEGIEDSPTVREVLKRVRAILARIKESKP